jgi:predicted permease
MTSISLHLRHAARRLIKSPLFTLTAVASIAIGIGANTAIFTAANAIFLAPTAGVRDMTRLVDVGRTTGGRGFDTLSYATYADLRDRNTVFDGVYALELEPKPLSLGTEGGAERIYGHLVSASYFDVLGLEPSAGTFFRSTEEQVGVPLRKAVLSHALWVSRFSSQPDVVGRTIILNSDVYTVVGVGPQGYRGSTIITPDVWLPLTAYGRGFPTEEAFRGRRNSWLILTARLKPGVTIAGAQAYADTFMADLRNQFPEELRDVGLTVAPASRVPGVGNQFIAPFLLVLMGVSGLVLIVTCTNLAGLFIARAASRSREVAVRLALGASRKSLAAMLMTDAILVSVAGAAAALVVAYWTAGAMVAATSAVPFPITLELAIDWRVLGFTAGVAALTACLIGLAPALQSVRANLVPDLKSDASAPRRQRLRNIFITIQLATCLVLIVMAGLFLRALGAATATNPGFEVARIDVATLDLSLTGQPMERAPEMAAGVRQALAVIPGLDRVAYSRMVPLDGGGLGLGELRRPGTPGPDPELRTDWNVVSPEFFDTIGLPVLRGRAFTMADRQGAPRVAIVNERLARAVWPGQDPIGQQLLNGDFRPGRESSLQTLTIVGVARDAKYRWLGEMPAPFIYVPYAQQPMREVNFLVRRAADAPATLDLQTAVRQALKTFDPNLPLVRMQSLASYADLGLLPQRLAASVAGSLGVVALLLAGIGIYGVTAFAVASRTREIGVRIALGADRARVLRLVLRQGAKLAAIGGAIGLAVALAASQLISSLLFGVSPVDPLTYAGTASVLAFVTLLATFVPARRAAAVDPIQALKAE